MLCAFETLESLSKLFDTSVYRKSCSAVLALAGGMYVERDSFFAVSLYHRCIRGCWSRCRGSRFRRASGTRVPVAGIPVCGLLRGPATTESCRFHERQSCPLRSGLVCFLQATPTSPGET